MAEELRDLVDKAKLQRGKDSKDQEKTVPIGRPKGDLAGLLSASLPKNRLGEMVLDDRLDYQLKRVVREQRQASRLLAHGLAPRRKLLLVGPPGTGKTLTASVLAGSWDYLYIKSDLMGLLQNTWVSLQRNFARYSI